MAKNKGRKNEEEDLEEDFEEEDEKPHKKRGRPAKRGYLKSETKKSIYAILSYIGVFFFLLSAFGKTGIAGKVLYDLFIRLFGEVGYFILPAILLVLGITFTKEERPATGLAHAVSSAFTFASGIGLISLLFGREAGGIVGFGVTYPFITLFDIGFSVLVFSATFLISLIILFDTEFTIQGFWNRLRNVDVKLGKKKLEPIEVPITTNIPKEEISTPDSNQKPAEFDKKKKTAEDELDMRAIVYAERNKAYAFPPLTLLEGDKGRPQVGDIRGNAAIIKRTLANFGILVEMDEVTVGPTVTRYALKPAEGVKLSKILGLQNDLALALAAHPLRIEAPIPGKSLVGIEIPNTAKSIVGLATLLSDGSFTNSAKPLLIALGRSISGKAVFGDLAKMPHALIAGTTGSGKSITIHSIITSLLYRNSPENLRFIMVDPKRVELTLFNKIPHLLTPVITDPKKAILALKWAAKEMERRYNVLQEESVRDIGSYHKKIGDSKKKEGKETMPYIVIIIDELADIMATYPRELESAIVRLAQMSRAVGIHLILSTQRPSVNVITGLIKANVPTRVALQVASQIDSRTILDQAGAEKLLGAGDMLYLGSEMPQPERVQSAYVTEEELKKVVKFIADNSEEAIPEDITMSTASAPGDGVHAMFDPSALEKDSTEDDDDLYGEAERLVIESGKASTSYLQRRLSVGYSRAARLIDILEERGVIGPGNGAKPREIFKNKEELDNTNNSNGF